MEFSLAPFSSEPGSPWMRLINLLVEAMVDESMKEMEQGQPSIRQQVLESPRNSRARSQRKSRIGAATIKTSE